jgi:hypothetical protein
MEACYGCLCLYRYYLYGYADLALSFALLALLPVNNGQDLVCFKVQLKQLAFDEFDVLLFHCCCF